MYINVRSFGAVGDGVTDDTRAIQAAIDSLEEGNTLYFDSATAFNHISNPTIYIVKETLEIKTRNIKIEGESNGVIIKTKFNITNDPAINLNAEYITISNISIYGEGGEFGEGAKNGSGIVFNNASHCRLNNVIIRGHGGHGIEFTGGIWCNSIINCTITDNFQDGINSYSITEEIQNGNNLSILNSVIFKNKGNGLLWNASALNISGCTIEQNEINGIYIKAEPKHTIIKDEEQIEIGRSAKGFSIVGNYLEKNGQSEIFLESTIPTLIYTVSKGVIQGNFFYKENQYPIIKGSGVLDGIYIGYNSYTSMNNSIAPYISLGSEAKENCFVSIEEEQAGRYVDLGFSAVKSFSKSKTLYGLFSQTGVNFTELNKSDAFTLGLSETKTIFFDMGLSQNDVIDKIKLEVFTASTNYRVAISVLDGNGNPNLIPIKYFDNLNGNNICEWIVKSTYGPLRLGGGNCLLKIEILNNDIAISNFEISNVNIKYH